MKKPSLSLQQQAEEPTDKLRTLKDRLELHLATLTYKASFRRPGSSQDPVGFDIQSCVQLIEALEEGHQQSVGQALKAWAAEK